MDFAFGSLKNRRLENSVRPPQINAHEDAETHYAGSIFISLGRGGFPDAQAHTHDAKDAVAFFQIAG